ncbi:NifU family protein [Halosolutus gelatinilyticus]|uniref:NifU family protein n=1 Tax=Halosolutus gelatinilyticus TaxID=2931975 RepID=UPI001FF529B0|nr:NifU family protein [Halosolutus gelatinilyticus]
MSDTRSVPTVDEISDSVSLFLRRNFPQIEAHGGDFAITDVDPDERSVSITLSGACDGCGISPMTTQAIQRRLPSEVDGIDRVDVSLGFDGMAGEGTPRGAPDDVPF